MWDFNRCNAATRAPSKQNITRALGFAADNAVTESDYFQSLHGVGEFVFERVAPASEHHETCARGEHLQQHSRNIRSPRPSFALTFTAQRCLFANLPSNATLGVDERVRSLMLRKSILPHSERRLSRVAVSSWCRQTRTRAQSGAHVAGRFQQSHCRSCSAYSTGVDWQTLALGGVDTVSTTWSLPFRDRKVAATAAFWPCSEPSRPASHATVGGSRRPDSPAWPAAFGVTDVASAIRRRRLRRPRRRV